MIKFFEKTPMLAGLFAFLIAAAIFILSSFSIKTQPSEGINLSFAYHFIAFFWLAFFLSLALIKGKRKNFLLVSIILALIYAFSDEFHQIFVPYRSFAIPDLLMDSFGVLFANFIYLLSLKKSDYE